MRTTKRKRISRSPEAVERDRVVRERMEKRLVEIERQTGTTRDQWDVERRVAEIERSLGLRRDVA